MILVRITTEICEAGAKDEILGAIEFSTSNIMLRHCMDYKYITVKIVVK